MRNYILAILLTAVSVRAEISRLEALSLIESGDNDAAVGRAGEVSRFQIMPRVWAHYSRSRAFRDCRVSREVATKHLAELTSWFQRRAGRPASDFDIYVLWNAGPTYYHALRFKPSRVHPVVRERASRYAGLRAVAPGRPTSPDLAALSSRQSVPAGKPAAPASLRRGTPEPIWPVFEQPSVPARAVPAFALSPVVLPLLPPETTTRPPVTLGAFVLAVGP